MKVSLLKTRKKVLASWHTRMGPTMKVNGEEIKRTGQEPIVMVLGKRKMECGPRANFCKQNGSNSSL
jgi:hypothetical protein